MGLHNIFSIPIYTTILESKIVEYIEGLITPRLSNLPQFPEQKTDFHSSKIISREEVIPFFNYISKNINNFSTQSNLLASTNIDYWIQDYKQNEYHGAHTHMNSNISGIYYVRANQNAGELKFINPNPIFNVIDFKEGIKNEIEFRIKPQKGMLVLFPGWLLHEALPSSNKDCIRTCLAFNLLK